MQIGVLASGSGTVCEAILDAGLPVRLVLADRDCPALVIAAARGVDHEPILAQVAVRVVPDDTEISLHERIDTEERLVYVQTISDILERGTVL